MKTRLNSLVKGSEKRLQIVDRNWKSVLKSSQPFAQLSLTALKPAWFSYVGKIPDDWGFYFLPTIPDFADISDIRRGLSQIFPISLVFSRDAMFICDRGTEVQQFRGLVMSEIHRRRTPTSRRYKFEFSFVGNDRRPSQKSGTRRENRNAPDSPDLSQFIPDDRGYLRFRVFISRQNLGRSGNSKIPDRLGFSRHM